MHKYDAPVPPDKPKYGRKTTRSKSMPAMLPNKTSNVLAAARLGLPPCLIEAVDTAVAEAFAKTYSADPLIPEEVVALRGPVDSVLRRHGLLIETALAVALDLSPEVEVMTQVAVPVSDAAIQLCLANADDKTIGLTLPVSGAIAKTAVIDVVAYYPQSGRLIGVSVKRGGGAQGGTAARNGAIELRAAAMILRAMLMGRGRVVSSTEVVTVDYLGRSGILAGTVIGADQLDSFFGRPVRATIDAMTDYMSAEVGSRIDEAIEALVRKRRPEPIAVAPLLHADAKHRPGIGADVGMSGKPKRGRKPKSHALASTQSPTAPPPLPSLAECLSILPRIKGRQSRLHS